MNESLDQMVPGMYRSARSTASGQSFAGEETTAVDKNLHAWYTRDLELTIRGIMLEIAEERIEGRVRPFVEGEPIGAYPGPRVIVQQTEPLGARYQRRQQAIREMRAANDAALDKLSRR